MPSLSSVPRRLGNLGSRGVASTPGKGSRAMEPRGGGVFMYVYVCYVYRCVLVHSMCFLYTPVLLCTSACWVEGEVMASDISELLCLQG